MIDRYFAARDCGPLQPVKRMTKEELEQILEQIEQGDRLPRS